MKTIFLNLPAMSLLIQRIVANHRKNAHYHSFSAGEILSVRIGHSNIVSQYKYSALLHTEKELLKKYLVDLLFNPVVVSDPALIVARPGYLPSSGYCCSGGLLLLSSTATSSSVSSQLPTTGENSLLKIETRNKQ